jgi:dTMP kinase
VSSRTRAGGEAADRLEREGFAFHERVREGYLTLAREDARFVTVDGSQSPDAVLAAAWETFAAKLHV